MQRPAAITVFRAPAGCCACATGGGSAAAARRGRSASANSAETRAFVLSREKRILVLSEAGGLGCAHHADHDAHNTARGVHFQRLGAQVQAVLRRAADSALKMVGHRLGRDVV